MQKDPSSRMDPRIEARKKEFKKSFEDPRRKREDEQVQIRRAAREQHLAKKRQQVVSLLPPLRHILSRFLVGMASAQASRVESPP